jgi:hypothetical protein
VALNGDPRDPPATAAVLTTIPWPRDGERRLEPVSTSSLIDPGHPLARAAHVPMRTLPDGVVCLAEPASTGGGISLIRVPLDGGRRSTALLPGPPGWRLIDFIALQDNGWVVLEAVPGPPDQVRVRRIATDASTAWTNQVNAGTPEALSGLLCAGQGAVFGVTGTAPRRLVRLEADTGATRDALDLRDADGACVMNGAGRLGYLSGNVADGGRLWVTVDARTKDREATRLPDGSGMEYAIGLDAAGRSYWHRFATLVCRGRNGEAEWELEVAQAIVDGDRVWVQQRPSGGRQLVALPLAAEPDTAGSAVILNLPDSEPTRAWRLVGRDSEGDFVLHGTTGANDAGVLARIDHRGRVADLQPAGESVWLEWFDMQRPTGAAVTDAGEVDIATRGPGGLSVIRIRPR